MTKAGMPLAEALAIADELVNALRPGACRIAVAGSIRRGKARVGDVEIVAVPRITRTEVPGLWGSTWEPTNELQGRVARLIEWGDLSEHPTDPKRGARYAKLVHTGSGIQVDLFMPADLDAWGIIYLIRTGPAEYSRRLVTDMRDPRRGGRAHHVAEGQLHRGIICTAHCERVPTPDEAAVYAALGLPWVAPDRRR